MSEELSDLREFVFNNLDKGLACPCCGQFAKRYKRRLNSGMAYMLCILVQIFNRNGGEWVHIQELSGARVATGSADFAKLRYWKLISAKINEDETKRCSGLWKPTEKGRYFVLGRTRMPTYSIVYNKMFHGFQGEEITIHEALGNHFNYEELMRGV